jgi:hypothetical protein
MLNQPISLQSPRRLPLYPEAGVSSGTENSTLALAFARCEAGKHFVRHMYCPSKIGRLPMCVPWLNFPSDGLVWPGISLSSMSRPGAIVIVLRTSPQGDPEMSSSSVATSPFATPDFRASSAATKVSQSQTRYSV